ncbi:MAG TPA: 1,4-dihydroxy-2-naphthoate polyprenyltransferase [Dehalococcoidia bacterium]|nr:1,4-dihydroxy-2-naphthoate polyprenyltransferase [Dehalococcoidia bacterium]
MASRPATLTASLTPVLVGAGAAWDWGLRPGVLAATLAAALLVQVGTNLANDVADYERGADAADRLGPPRAVALGLISPTAMRCGALAAFALAALVGLYLAWEGGWPVLLMGSLALLAGTAYTGGPWPYGYRALGDAVCFLTFGVMAVVGTYYLQAGRLDVVPFLASLPVACTVTAILVVNNLRDLASDRRAGKVTMAVLLGDVWTRRYYAGLLLAAYALCGATAAAGGPWSLLPWLSLPLAVRLALMVLGGATGQALNRVLVATARLHLLLGCLLALGLAL